MFPNLFQNFLQLFSDSRKKELRRNGKKVPIRVIEVSVLIIVQKLNILSLK